MGLNQRVYKSCVWYVGLWQRCYKYKDIEFCFGIVTSCHLSWYIWRDGLCTIMRSLLWDCTQYPAKVRIQQKYPQTDPFSAYNSSLSDDLQWLRQGTLNIFKCKAKLSKTQVTKKPQHSHVVPICPVRLGCPKHHTRLSKWPTTDYTSNLASKIKNN